MSFIYHVYSKGRDGNTYADEFISTADMSQMLKKCVCIPADGAFPYRMIHEVKVICVHDYPKPVEIDPLADPPDLSRLSFIPEDYPAKREIYPPNVRLLSGTLSG